MHGFGIFDEIFPVLQENDNIVSCVYYGHCPPWATDSKVPILFHVPAPARQPNSIEIPKNIKLHHCSNEEHEYFALPSSVTFNHSAASVAHTRSLAFMKPLLGGPYFDLEAIWDEHTKYEFEDRSVDKTMATMVDEPYVNHIPTLTGGIGRENLTKFYRDHFIHSNAEDAQLELVSRTVGIDRIVDEFLFNFTHDRVVDWL